MDGMNSYYTNRSWEISICFWRC